MRSSLLRKLWIFKEEIQQAFGYSFIQPINIYLENIYLANITTLGTGDLALNKRNMIYLLMRVQYRRHNSKVQRVGPDG